MQSLCYDVQQWDSYRPLKKSLINEVRGKMLIPENFFSCQSKSTPKEEKRFQGVDTYTRNCYESLT
jgi:hypothetical protein